ncbi:MAG: hypothetical protein AAF400_00530 [Bacteroidota bacterium]
MHFKDPRVALGKLAARLHNMRTMQGHPSSAKQKQVANEALTGSVPMANMPQRIGMAQELEKLILEVLGK